MKIHTKQLMRTEQFHAGLKLLCAMSITLFILVSHDAIAASTEKNWAVRLTGGVFQLNAYQSNGTTARPQSTNAGAHLVFPGGWGMGAGKRTATVEIEGIKHTYSGSMADLSYTVGDVWNLTMGLGIVVGGEGTIEYQIASYTTRKASGGGLWTMLGYRIYFLEALIGLRFDRAEYSEFTSEVTHGTLESKVRDDSVQMMMGLGITF